MELSVELKESSADSATLTASVRVEGKLVTSVRQLRMAPA
jgi:hypothetical protein